MIETLEQLYDALAALYPGIGEDCLECTDPDCAGYAWLLEDETERLFERGVPLVQLNAGPTFIHSFQTGPDGKLNFAVRYPPCSQLCKDSQRRCSIYHDRPFVCRLYPLGLETEPDGTFVWALHLDCLHVRRMEARGAMAAFDERAKALIASIAPELYQQIVSTYRGVDALVSYPEGRNAYRVLREV